MIFLESWRNLCLYSWDGTTLSTFIFLKKLHSQVFPWCPLVEVKVNEFCSEGLTAAGEVFYCFLNCLFIVVSMASTVCPRSKLCPTMEPIDSWCSKSFEIPMIEDTTFMALNILKPIFVVFDLRSMMDFCRISICSKVSINQRRDRYHLEGAAHGYILGNNPRTKGGLGTDLSNGIPRMNRNLVHGESYMRSSSYRNFREFHSRKLYLIVTKMDRFSRCNCQNWSKEMGCLHLWEWKSRV